MTYIVLFIISTIVILFMHLASIKFAEIDAVKEYRERSAVTVFPIVPLFPFILIVICWVINTANENLGYWIFIGIHSVFTVLAASQFLYATLWLTKHRK